jgi:6-phosphogluconolactonase
MKFLLTLLITYFVSIHFVTAETFVFIGSYNYDKNKEGIFVYQLDTLTGAITKVTAAKDVLNPSYFTLSQNGQFLFSCTETRTPGNGSISSYQFDAVSKTLTFINTQKTGGENPVYAAYWINRKIIRTCCQLQRRKYFCISHFKRWQYCF